MQSGNIPFEAMEQEDFDCYLATRYDDQCQWYSQKATFNKRWYYRFQTAIISFSAATTLTLAVEGYLQGMGWLRLAALTMASIVTILAGLLKVYRFQEHWIDYRNTAETLKKERYLHKAGIGEYGNSDSPDRLFVDRVETLVSRQNTVWVARSNNDEAGT